MRALLSFFALGVLIAALYTVSMTGGMPELVLVPLSWLTAPGVIASLPLHNFVIGGWLGVVGVIAVANGLAYGLAAYLVALLIKRFLDDGW